MNNSTISNFGNEKLFIRSKDHYKICEYLPLQSVPFIEEVNAFSSIEILFPERFSISSQDSQNKNTHSKNQFSQINQLQLHKENSCSAVTGSSQPVPHIKTSNIKLQNFSTALSTHIEGEPKENLLSHIDTQQHNSLTHLSVRERNEPENVSKTDSSHSFHPEKSANFQKKKTRVKVANLSIEERHIRRRKQNNDASGSYRQRKKEFNRSTKKDVHNLVRENKNLQEYLEKLVYILDQYRRIKKKLEELGLL